MVIVIELLSFLWLKERFVVVFEILFFKEKKKSFQVQTPAWGSFYIQPKLENLDSFLYQVTCAH